MKIRDIIQDLLRGVNSAQGIVEFLGSLNESESKEIVQMSSDLLGSPEENTRANAMWLIEILKPSMPDIIPTLLVAQKDSNLYVRSHATVYIAERGFTDAISELINILRNSSLDSQTRSRAAIVLGHLGNREAVTALIDCLDDKNTNVAWNVIYALSASDTPEVYESLRKTYLTDRRITSLGMSLVDEAEIYIRSRSRHLPH